LSRNIQNKGTGCSGQGAVKERDTGYMRDGMKKEKKQGAGWKIWDCRFLIADFRLLILLSLFLAHLR